jgi:hypothetical protein
MPLVFGSQARDATLRGVRQILKLHEDLFAESDEPDLSPRCRYFIFRAGARDLKFHLALKPNVNEVLARK